MRRDVACFAVTLRREGKQLSLAVESGSTIRRGIVAGEWDDELGASAFKRAGKIGSVPDPNEAARVEAVAKAFISLLENLNEDLRDCSCEPGDLCPRHALENALK